MSMVTNDLKEELCIETCLIVKIGKALDAVDRQSG